MNFLPATWTDYDRIHLHNVSNVIAGQFYGSHFAIQVFVGDGDNVLFLTLLGFDCRDLSLV